MSDFAETSLPYRSPRVVPLAKVCDGDCYIVVQTVRKEGRRQVQALNLDGVWVDRPEGFQADPEVTFINRHDDGPFVELPDHILIAEGTRAAGIPSEDATVEGLTRLHYEALKRLGEAPKPSLWRRILNKIEGVIIFARYQR